MTERDPYEYPCEITLPYAGPRSGLSLLLWTPLLLLVLWGGGLLWQSFTVVGFNPTEVDWRGTSNMLSGLAALAGAALAVSATLKALLTNPQVQSDAQEQQATGVIETAPELAEGDTI